MIFLMLISALIFITAQSQLIIHDEAIIATGNQPQVSADANGTIRIAFGKGDKIFCATSVDNGASF